MPNPFPSIISDPDLIVETPPASESDEEVEVIRENINTDDIFESAQAPLTNEVAPLVVEPVVKEKKKRKPMTEEHKAKLKIAREKAMMSKKKNALERK